MHPAPTPYTIPPPPPPSENNNHCLHTFVLQSPVIRSGLYGLILAVSTSSPVSKMSISDLPSHVQGFNSDVIYLVLTKTCLIVLLCYYKQSTVTKCKEI